MAPVKKKTLSGHDEWKERHSAILRQGIVDLVKKHRKELYKLRGLEGEVDGHGGDRIRQKIDIMMKGFLKG